MNNFTVMACAREYKNGPVSDFAVIHCSINEFGGFKMESSCFEDWNSGFSKLLSKLPVIRNYRDLTDYQKRLSVAIDCIDEADELIVGSYRRDITPFSQMYREMRGTQINANSIVFDVKQPVREVSSEVKSFGSRLTLLDITDHFDIALDDAYDLACSVFGADSWDNVQHSAVRACIYLLAKLRELGYESDDVTETLTRHYDTGNVYEGTVCYIERRETA